MLGLVVAVAWIWVESSARDVGTFIELAAPRSAATCSTPSQTTALAVPFCDSPTSATRAIDRTGREVGDGVGATCDASTLEGVAAGPDGVATGEGLG
jgi:hypothetical protein